jgi:hypothetical protein
MALFQLQFTGWDGGCTAMVGLVPLAGLVGERRPPSHNTMVPESGV